MWASPVWGKQCPTLGGFGNGYQYLIAQITQGLHGIISPAVSSPFWAQAVRKQPQERRVEDARWLG
jgi:hypothetical protein